VLDYQKKYSLGVLISILLIIVFIYIINLKYFGIPVLNYHIISNREINPIAITPKEFDEQMAYLHNNDYTTISPDDLLDYIQYNAQLPEKPILITFDDGYRDTYTEAYPILKKYNFTATIFLITDYVGNNIRYLNWEQVKEMHSNGFTFGSHTLNHVSLLDASNEYATYQLTKSREGIEWILKEQVKYFAYPGGFYNQTIAQLVKQSGYRAAFAVQLGKNTTTSDIYALSRIPIFKSIHSFNSFWLRLKCTQLVNIISEIRKDLACTKSL
jgi:peptidoglycan/xylan/chitin deacetylase (PgdA/CDA1 family)